MTPEFEIRSGPVLVGDSMSDTEIQTAAIVLAAGRSTRMRSSLPKVLHEVCGRPMVGYVFSACRLAGVDRLLAVVGHGKDQVQSSFEADHDLEWIDQPEQLGTGDAVARCKKALAGFKGSVVVVAGDMPLVQRDTIGELLHVRADRGDALTMATTELDDPMGYGRILRNGKGELIGIIEHKECAPEQLAIAEVNPSYYCFDAEKLFSILDELRPANTSGELYLTDAVAALRKKGEGVSAVVKVAPEDAMGINTRLGLARVARAMQDRIQWKLMSEGVTIVDPDNTWIEADVSMGCDTVVYPFSYVGLGATIGEGCRIGPFAHIVAGETVPEGEVRDGQIAKGVGV